MSAGLTSRLGEPEARPPCGSHEHRLQIPQPHFVFVASVRTLIYPSTYFSVPYFNCMRHALASQSRAIQATNQPAQQLYHLTATLPLWWFHPSLGDSLRRRLRHVLRMSKTSKGNRQPPLLPVSCRRRATR